MQAFNEITLRTERLLLRPKREADAQDLFKIFSDPLVARYLSDPAWPAMDKAHERIARDIKALPEGEYLSLGIERMEDKKLIGECSLFNFMKQCRRVEIGYVMSASAWGHGYMHEALVALLDLAFTKLNINRVEADIDPRNAASAKSLERLGFVKEGYLRERWIVGDEVSDSALYGLLLSDWQTGKHRAENSAEFKL